MRFLTSFIYFILHTAIIKAATIEPALQTTAIIKNIGREIALERPQSGDYQKLSRLLADTALATTIASYATPIEPTQGPTPTYNSPLKGIRNSDDLCYIIAPSQLVWALQKSLYKHKKIPSYVGCAGTDISSLLLTALAEHEKQGKSESASPTSILFALRNWMYKYVPEAYDGVPALGNAHGRSDAVLELYLKNLNALCQDSAMPAPFPIMQRTTEKTYVGPIICFVPEFYAEDEQFDCEQPLLKAISALFPQCPPLLRFRPARAHLTPTTSFCIPVNLVVKTNKETVHYLLRGALLQDKSAPHTTTLIRKKTSSGNNWFICDDDLIIKWDNGLTQAIATHNTVILDNVYPSDIMYERQQKL